MAALLTPTRKVPHNLPQCHSHNLTPSTPLPTVGGRCEDVEVPCRVTTSRLPSKGEARVQPHVPSGPPKRRTIFPAFWTPSTIPLNLTDTTDSHLLTVTCQDASLFRYEGAYASHVQAQLQGCVLPQRPRCVTVLTVFVVSLLAAAHPSTLVVFLPDPTLTSSLTTLYICAMGYE